MEQIGKDTEIKKDEVVGVIFESKGIFYCKFGFGKRPDFEGKQFKAYKGIYSEIIPFVEDTVEKLNKGSAAWQQQRREWQREKEENRQKIRGGESRASPKLRSRIRKMAGDPRVFDLFS